MFDTDALQEYLLMCCQDSRGGLIDKPGKFRDFYHTCYALSGLSVAQYALDSSASGGPAEDFSNVIGDHANKLVSQLFL